MIDVVINIVSTCTYSSSAEQYVLLRKLKRGANLFLDVSGHVFAHLTK